MMDTECDTTFQGFADLLFEDLSKFDTDVYFYYGADEAYERLRIRIAQRAYDLALHVLENAPIFLASEPDNVQSWRERLQNLLSTMPDLTQWPTS